MAGLTYLDLQDAVLFNTLGTRFRTPVQAWLKDAVEQTCRSLRLQKVSQVGAADSNGFVTLAQPAWRVLEVWAVAAGATGVVSTAEVERRADRQLSPTGNTTGSRFVQNTGQPYQYEAVSQGGTIQLRVLPAPTNTPQVAVVAYCFPTAMSADTDVSGLGNELDEALVAFCRARAFRREDDLQMAAMWEAEYVSRLRAVVPTHIQHTDGPQTTPGSDSYANVWTGGG